jgi:hypothetical protein
VYIWLIGPDGLTEEWFDGWLDGCIDGWMDGCTMNGWTEA